MLTITESMVPVTAPTQIQLVGFAWHHRWAEPSHWSLGIAGRRPRVQGSLQHGHMLLPQRKQAERGFLVLHLANICALKGPKSWKQALWVTVNLHIGWLEVQHRALCLCIHPGAGFQSVLEALRGLGSRPTDVPLGMTTAGESEVTREAVHDRSGCQEWEVRRPR